MTEPRVFYHPGGPVKDAVDPTYHYGAGWCYLAPDWDDHMHVWNAYKKGGNPTKLDAERQLKSHLYHNHWAKIWRAAFNNMPQRRREWKETNWMALPKGTTPVPTYIAGQAHGTHRIIDGVVCVLETTTRFRHYGQNALLARMLKFLASERKSNPRKVPSGHWIHNAMTNGRQPKDPVARELLLKLSGPDGNKIAWQYLEEHGIAKRYVR